MSLSAILTTRVTNEDQHGAHPCGSDFGAEHAFQALAQAPSVVVSWISRLDGWAS